MLCIDEQALASWAEGRLSKREAATLLLHLERCDDCRLAADLLEQQQRVNTLCGDLVDASAA
ncbi:MAG: zf-HC2 domain-containing protein [Archangiaceae bacterium]|nr:zf-HC2 domain-containing protein [Archangiaceae bacterium]